MRLAILALSLSFLASMTGCSLTTSGGCGTSGCGTGGCSTGSCGSGGCGLSAFGSRSGCGNGCGLSAWGRWMHSHGVCDCEYDDYCSSRSPWIRTNGGGIVHTPIAVPASEPIPTPKVLPDSKKGL